MDLRPADSSGRLRDFVVIVIGAITVLLILALSGALGWVEATTAAVVVSTGCAAYYVGTTEPARAARPKVQDEGAALSPVDVDFQPLVEALPAPGLYVSPDRRIAAANGPARAIFRLQEGELGMTTAVLRHPALLTAIEQSMDQAASQIVEITRTGAPDQIWFAHVSALANPMVGVLVVLEDKSEARRAEQARADFLANASHELRTPLTSVAGFIETMRGPAKDDKASWDRFLEIMFEQTERMRRLIQDLLSLSRIEFSEHRPPSDTHDLVPIIAKATQALAPIALERDVALTFEAPSGPLPAVSDADEITQAIQNLITNAVKYSPDGTHVQVELGRAKSMDLAKARAGRAWSDGARMTILEAPRNEGAEAAYLRVTDQGPGIETQYLPRLGQRFYRVDSSRGGEITGTGLGLAIVKHIMARHRGGLIVESIPGRGSAFGLWLPASAGGSAPASPSRQTGQDVHIREQF